MASNFNSYQEWFNENESWLNGLHIESDDAYSIWCSAVDCCMNIINQTGNQDINDNSESINTKNQELFIKYQQEHIADEGKVPVAYAVTELIQYAIDNKIYKKYSGGGYEHRTKNRIKNFDVVYWLDFHRDPHFDMCIDNSEGDSCDLIHSDSNGNVLKRTF